MQIYGSIGSDFGANQHNADIIPPNPEEQMIEKEKQKESERQETFTGEDF